MVQFGDTKVFVETLKVILWHENDYSTLDALKILPSDYIYSMLQDKVTNEKIEAAIVKHNNNLIDLYLNTPADEPTFVEIARILESPLDESKETRRLSIREMGKTLSEQIRNSLNLGGVNTNDLEYNDPDGFYLISISNRNSQRRDISDDMMIHLTNQTYAFRQGQRYLKNQDPLMLFDFSDTEHKMHLDNFFLIHNLMAAGTKNV
jgi:hypothetical protein